MDSNKNLSDDSNVVKIFSTTGSHFVKARHTWKISDFQKLMDFSKVANQSKFYSKSFSVKVPNEFSEVKDKIQFSTSLYWNHVDDEDTQLYLGLFLNHNRNPDEPEVTAKFTFKLRCPSGADLWPQHSQIRKFGSSALSAWGFQKYKKKQEVLNHALDQDGALTIICDLEIFTKHPWSAGEAAVASPVGLCLGEELLTSLDHLKDVKIVVENEEPLRKKKKSSEKTPEKQNSVWCHKIVLQARSDVFRAMFAHDTAENQTNTIHMDDTTYETLQVFVEFLYTDQLNDFDFPALSKLLPLGEKYNVASLKYRCEKQLSAMIDNTYYELGQFVQLAERYNCQSLRRALINHMASSFNEVKKEAWFAKLPQAFKAEILDQMSK